MQPNGWPTPVYQFSNNQVTNAGFALGKKIFFDTRLSSDGTVSCATCHQPFAAFANFAHPLSHGVNGQFGHRNAPALFNLAWHKSFMWDGGVNNIENQPINPIQNPVEMNMPLASVLNLLSSDPDYPNMFKDAFGDKTINSQRLSRALAQFMGVLQSYNSKYDHYIRGEAGGDMTSQELSGLNIYQQKCAQCHPAPLFSDFSYRNNGLQPDPTLNDSGRAHITRDTNDMYKFKVPSLRNLKYSIPYMHDGRFNALYQVFDHYATGIYKTGTLDTALQNGIQLTSQQRDDLSAFLNTLNDTGFVNDPRFQKPSP